MGNICLSLWPLTPQTGGAGVSSPPAFGSWQRATLIGMPAQWMNKPSHPGRHSPWLDQVASHVRVAQMSPVPDQWVPGDSRDKVAAYCMLRVHLYTCNERSEHHACSIAPLPVGFPNKPIFLWCQDALLACDGTFFAWLEVVTSWSLLHDNVPGNHIMLGECSPSLPRPLGSLSVL